MYYVPVKVETASVGVGVDVFWVLVGVCVWCVRGVRIVIRLVWVDTDHV